MNATLTQELQGAVVAVTKEFITAGHAIFTVGVPEHFQELNNTKSHYTFMIRRMAEKDGLKSPMFASLLTGPDNTNDYQYIGVVRRDGTLVATRKSSLPASSWVFRILSRCLARIFAGEQHLIESAGFSLHHEGRCCRCARRLTTLESILSGIGPECAKIMRSE